MSFELRLERQLGNRQISLSHDSEGGLVALFGPSGAGKTSILNMVAGLLKPDSGRIIIDGETLFDSEHSVNLPPEQRRVGYVFQDLRLFPHKTVAENLRYGQRPYGPVDFDEVVNFLGIGHLLARWPSTLSGGEAQRVAIGRALLSKPRILLMDEPLASLDAARRNEIMRVIERLRDELRMPILYVSHDRDEVARLAHRVVSVGN